MTRFVDPGFFVALVAALILTPLVRLLALKIGFVDAPRADRHHVTPTPYLGGLAVILALAAGLLASGRIDLAPDRLTLETAHPFTILLFVTTTAFFLGLVDDWRHLAPPAKLAGQVLIASIFMAAAGPGPFASPGADGAVGVLWVVGLMNAFNFLDNMDGMLTGVSLASIAGLMLIALATGGLDTAAWLFPLAGALAGYLVFNFPPARIFLGDAGSLMLGAGLAAAGWGVASHPFAGAVLSGSAAGTAADLAGASTGASGQPGAGVAAWIALPLAMAYPIFDITFVTLTRLKRGQSPWVGGRDHTTHRIATALGRGKRAAALAVYGLALTGSLGAWVVAGSEPGVGLAVVAGMGVLFAALGAGLARVRVG